MTSPAEDYLLYHCHCCYGKKEESQIQYNTVVKTVPSKDLNIRVSVLQETAPWRLEKQLLAIRKNLIWTGCLWLLHKSREGVHLHEAGSNSKKAHSNDMISGGRKDLRDLFSA